MFIIPQHGSGNQLSDATSGLVSVFSICCPNYFSKSSSTNGPQPGQVAIMCLFQVRKTAEAIGFTILNQGTRCIDHRAGAGAQGSTGGVPHQHRSGPGAVERLGCCSYRQRRSRRHHCAPRSLACTGHCQYAMVGNGAYSYLEHSWQGILPALCGDLFCETGSDLAGS